ncbi:hypothetical protein BH09PLA1_BH09PLA1_21310 [soil metagenome]
MKRTSTDSTTAVLTIGPDDRANVGEVLRRIHREEPAALLVWIDASAKAQRAELIGELRRRRPRLPLIALSSEHDAAIEQSARVAGAAFYLPMTCPADVQLLNHTLETLGIQVAKTGEHSGLPPPARASPCPS